MNMNIIIINGGFALQYIYRGGMRSIDSSRRGYTIPRDSTRVTFRIGGYPREITVRFALNLIKKKKKIEFEFSARLNES